MFKKASMYQMTINDIVIDVVRKNIKNLRMVVGPPDGKVRIAAPLRMKDEAVQAFVMSKLTWLNKHIKKFLAQPEQKVHAFISGETHYYQGKAYVLNVIQREGHGKVILRDAATTMDLYAPQDADTDKRQRILQRWYRKQLQLSVPFFISKWQAIIGVTLMDYQIKKMKTRWGTCNIKARRIWLNLELIKKPIHCLEYVIVHELVHLLERSHNKRFVAFMDKFLPSWRDSKKELNSEA